MQATALLWFGIVAVIGLNGFAAGVTALLHIWKGGKSRQVRTIVAAFVSGLLPASVIILPLSGAGSSGNAELDIVVSVEPGTFSSLAVTFLTLLVSGSIVALPGAVAVARKLEYLGDRIRAFD